MGSGWFGQVIESEAAHIVDGSSRTKVVVKILKEDATKMEQKHFMEEVSVFRCLDHVNLLSFLGQCTDILPHLVILEFSPLGTLKTHLVCHRHEAEKLIKKNHLVTFALDVAAGLACLHRHDFIHKYVEWLDTICYKWISKII
uniref:Protein kinase domain-containing protein n=1 Tax=Biomphalaria glabrata TaxID=6526 RepID=A0A2C9KGP4_BIOGL